jgi:hypothetical protein
MASSNDQIDGLESSEGAGLNHQIEGQRMKIGRVLVVLQCMYHLVLETHALFWIQMLLSSSAFLGRNVYTRTDITILLNSHSRGDCNMQIPHTCGLHG